MITQLSGQISEKGSKLEELLLSLAISQAKSVRNSHTYSIDLAAAKLSPSPPLLVLGSCPSTAGHSAHVIKVYGIRILDIYMNPLASHVSFW